MDVHLHGTCMGKLVGPTGGGGTGISTQFRILPNSLPSECYSVDAEKVPVGSHRPGLHLRLSSPTTPHRTFNPEPLKIGDESNFPSGSNSPIPDSTPAGFLLHDAPAAVRRPSLTHAHTSPPAISSSPAKRITDVLDDKGDGVQKEVEDENLMMTN